MKKIFIWSVLFLLTLSPAFAAVTDFTADADITISDVTFTGVGTADMFIKSGSTAESWTYDGGTFTVTGTGTFMVGSSDTAVKSFKASSGGSTVDCEVNTTPGTSYMTLPSNPTGTYTIEPYSNTDCSSLCSSVANAATYNAFPTCGALTCDEGYGRLGSGSTATCVIANSGSSAPAPAPVPTTYQTYDPLTGELIIGETTTPDAPADTTPDAPATTPTGEATLSQMTSEAEIINTADVEQILSHTESTRDNDAEKTYSENIVNKITSGSGESSENINKITNFVTYGTQSTAGLGAGERGGIVNSFKSAFGKLPSSVEDWNDVIKIGNGRWPGQTNAAAEDRAKINFKIVYLREPDRSNPNDDAAITVMAYGLRPANRNLDSEKAAIKIFRNIYGYAPEKATAWDVVRAIAYSGATR